MVVDLAKAQSRIRGTFAEEALLALGSSSSGGACLVDIVTGDRVLSLWLVNRLRGYGLVEQIALLPGEAQLTADGWLLVEHVRASRVAGPDRENAVRCGLVSWLSERSPCSPMDFYGQTEACAFGVPFKEEEVQDAAGFLDSYGLTSASLVGDGLVVVTDQGILARYQPLPLREYMDTPLLWRGPVSLDCCNKVAETAHAVRAYLDGAKDPTVSAAIHAISDEALSASPSMERLRCLILAAVVAGHRVGLDPRPLRALASLDQNLY